MSWLPQVQYPGLMANNGDNFILIRVLLKLVVSKHTNNTALKIKNYENNVIPNVADSNVTKTKVSILL